MADYIPTPVKWVREHVELYEGSGGKQGASLGEGGVACIIVTHTGNKTGAIRKTPLIRVSDGSNYILVGSMGGAPKNPVWVYNLRASADVEIRDATEVHKMRVREVDDADERARVWALAVEAFPDYQEYQDKTSRTIPVFIATPV